MVISYLLSDACFHAMSCRAIVPFLKNCYTKGILCSGEAQVWQAEWFWGLTGKAGILM
ncbi:hypothetical protein JCM10003_1147 [Bacteroides pyogenes JCM 10003]|uniref:Uncharacterized protein n=2 Tax=Bacteroides pyogenes TaxID=310300 RepID=W4PJN1_9BACE|nr:hypothetical protein JCM6292_3023 [Bacteroides pyogenes JCM 6292]GAE19905.1 hypothetical protein JCM6294_3024 [Bacteroides pyogenes DSM 20611 = JCM 6294]GAE21665.1 hypothetical protein JCM10003_1147 [Bacteroides pyogenes JCM 10003]